MKEKLYIIFRPEGATLNAQSELYGSCRHRKKLLLENTWSDNYFVCYRTVDLPNIVKHNFCYSVISDECEVLLIWIFVVQLKLFIKYYLWTSFALNDELKSVRFTWSAQLPRKIEGNLYILCECLCVWEGGSGGGWIWRKAILLLLHRIGIFENPIPVLVIEIGIFLMIIPIPLDCSQDMTYIQSIYQFKKQRQNHNWTKSILK